MFHTCVQTDTGCVREHRRVPSLGAVYPSSKPSAGANSNTVTTSVVHANTGTCVFTPHRDTKSHVCTHTQRALNRVLSHQQGVCRFEDITWKTLGTGLTLGLGSL